MLDFLPSATKGGGAKRSRSRSVKQRVRDRGGKKERDRVAKQETVKEEELRAKAIDEVFRRKDKGKGKGKNKPRGGLRVPAELLGHNTSTPAGPLCYDFNLSTCNEAEPGARCKKGLHLCARKGCVDQKHGFKNCPRRFD